MNGFMKLATCSLLIGAGCQTPASLSNWSHRDELRNAAATEQLSGRIEKNSPGLSAQAAQLQPAQKLDEQIRLGQTEVSEWYRDKSPQRLKVARSHFESALTLVPQSSAAHHGIAIVADLEGNFSEAERHYQQALIQKPNDSDILGDLGYSYLLQNRFSESEQYSLRAVQANTANVNAIKHLGDAYARQGKTQLAQETYAKVYNPEEVQQALADHPPMSSPFSVQADKANSSIFDRLMPGKTPAEKLTADIQRRQEEYSSQLQQQRQRTQFSPQRPTSAESALPRERLAQESILKQQLQEIDREEMARYQEGPILVDDRTGELTRLPGAENPAYGALHRSAPVNPAAMSLHAPQPVGAAFPQPASPPSGGFPATNPMTENPALAGAYYGQQGAPVSSDAARMWNADGASSQPPPTPSFAQGFQGQSPPQQSFQPGPNTQYPTQTAPHFEMAPLGGQFQSQSAQQPATPLPQQTGWPAQQPWTGIQQAGGRQNDSMPVNPEMHSGAASAVIQANGQANVPFNSGNFPPAHPLNGGIHPQFAGGQFASGQQGPQNGMPSANAHPGVSPGPESMGNFAAMSAGVPSQNPQAGGNAMAAGNPMASAGAYREASRAAARMGMGVGPGGIFPVSNGSQTIQPPGSMSYENTRTPAPQRWMPDAVPPQNLNNAFQPDPNPVRSPASNMGPTPPVTYPSYSQEQFGTASRYDARTMQNSGVPQDYNTSMQGYETQRWIAGREANMAVRQIWNQGPMNSPVSPSAGSLYTHPTAQGMMFTPNTPGPNGQGLVPEQWPHPPVASRGLDQMNQSDPYSMQQASRNGMPATGLQGQQSQGQQSFGQYSMQGDFARGAAPSANGGATGSLNGPAPGNPINTSGSQSVSQAPANIVIPADYRSHTRQNSYMSPDGTQARDTGINDPAAWPTIIPASR